MLVLAMMLLLRTSRKIPNASSAAAALAAERKPLCDSQPQAQTVGYPQAARDPDTSARGRRRCGAR